MGPDDDPGEDPMVHETWKVAGSLYDAAASQADIHRVDQIYSDYGFWAQRATPCFAWVAQRRRFGWSLKHQIIQSGQELQPVTENTRALTSPFMHRRATLLRRPYLTLFRGSLMPAMHPLWVGFSLDVFTGDSHPLFGRSAPAQREEETERFVPALVFRRDDTGRRLEEFVATGRSAFLRDVTTLGVSTEQLDRLPAALAEAVLSAIAADPSGRVLEKLQGKPSFLVALGLVLGDQPDVWAPRAGLSEPLDALRAGAKERDVLACALSLRTQLRAGFPMLGESGPPRTLRGHDSPLVYAEVALAQQLPLHLASELWRLELPSACVPRDPSKRGAWLVAHRVLESAFETRQVDRWARRYVSQHGATLVRVFPHPHALWNWFRKSVVDGERHARFPTTSCSDVVRTLRSARFPHRPELDQPIHLAGVLFRRLGCTEDVRAAGRRAKSWLRHAERRDLEAAMHGDQFLFELVWEGGRGVAQLSGRAALLRQGQGTVDVCCSGPGGAPLSAEAAARVGRALCELALRVGDVAPQRRRLAGPGDV